MKYPTVFRVFSHTILYPWRRLTTIGKLDFFSWL